MGRRNGASGSTGRRSDRTAIRRRQLFPAGLRRTATETDVPGSTWESFFPGISWDEDLEWSRRQRR